MKLRLPGPYPAKAGDGQTDPAAAGMRVIVPYNHIALDHGHKDGYHNENSNILAL
jgi:hypothetical protein